MKYHYVSHEWGREYEDWLAREQAVYYREVIDMSLLGKSVRKVGGSFQHTGVVVAEFATTAGEKRIVLEFDAPVAGMLHVYRPDQVEVIV